MTTLVLLGRFALSLLVSLHCFALSLGVSVYCFSLLLGCFASFLAIFSDAAVFPSSGRR